MARDMKKCNCMIWLKFVCLICQFHSSSLQKWKWPPLAFRRSLALPLRCTREIKHRFPQLHWYCSIRLSDSTWKKRKQILREGFQTPNFPVYKEKDRF